MPRPPTSPRRTEGRRTHGRSARVVSAVLRATVEEIGRAGYEALRFEDVATRSAVNKTTIYRRWPTKVDLVSAALRNFSAAPEPPETGSVRSDLVELLEATARRAHSPLGRGIIRMVQTERMHPEVDQVTRQVAEEHMRARTVVIERAIGRGELPPGTDSALVIELAFAPLLRRLTTSKPVDDRFIQATVAVVLAGAQAGAAVRQATTPVKKKTPRRRA
jgi:AcrR family transcriptional regulator